MEKIVTIEQSRWNGIEIYKTDTDKTVIMQTHSPFKLIIQPENVNKVGAALLSINGEDKEQIQELKEKIATWFGEVNNGNMPYGDFEKILAEYHFIKKASIV